MTTIEEKRQQLLDQCRVVEHLAKQIARLYSPTQLPAYYAHDAANEILDIAGGQSAGIMETLGDLLSNLDGVTEEDEWTDPIFHRAHEMFPQEERFAAFRDERRPAEAKSDAV
jgi:hypothetical protein